MPRFILREESKRDYHVDQDHGGGLSLDGLRTGALLRIADAAEKMALRHTELIEQRDRFERWYLRESGKVASRDRTIAALRGQITKLRKKLAGPIDTR